MKKAILIILGVLVVLLGAAFILPIIYKDEIRAKVEQEIAKRVNAHVYFDDFGVSLFSHFPNLTASLENFGIVGKNDFKGDTLTAVKSFEVSVNLMSVISGDKLKVKALDLEEPRIFVKVLENGKANYDIYIADTTEVSPEVDTTKSEFAFQVDRWSIRDGYVVYDDRSTPMFAQLVDLDHSGSGDFTQDVFDMVTNTTIQAFTFHFDGTEYMRKKTIAADVTLNMNLPESKYTFQDNTFRVNDFAFGVDGWVALPDTTNTNMDIAFKAKENSFKSLLSLVPGVYTENFDELKAEGNVAFDGFVRGTYNANQLPGFGLNVLVKEGTMKYAGLPKAVNNINVALNVNNPDGNLKSTVVNIKQFHADMGNNPMDGRVLVKGLDPYYIEANVLAKLNLAELTQMFPLEGLALRGLYNLNLEAKGVYSDSLKKMPAIKAVMSLANGYVKSKDFPAPIEQLNFNAAVNNATGRMADTKINIPNFRMVLEGEPLTAKAYIEDLDDYAWDAQIKGGVNLTKLTKIYPLEDMTVAGHLLMDIQTKGKMSDVEAERFEKLATSGTVQVDDLTYTSLDLPQGMKITKANMSFTPQQINISSFNGFLGESPIAVTGSLSNYIMYVLKEDEIIRGQMAFKSSKFNLNEWLVDDPNSASNTEDEPLTVVEVPKNIDFTLVSSINQVLYDDMILKDLAGTIIIQNGVARMDQVAFNSLGGSFITNGTYDTRNMTNPAFDFDLNINSVSVQEAYKTFNTVQTLMPLAQYVQGSFSTDFKIDGRLAPNMMPVYSTLSGGGVIKLIQAVIKDAPVLNALENVTRLNNISPAQLRDVVMKAQIKDGRLHFEPFDVKLANYQMKVGGSNGLDGSLAYDVKMDIPAGAVGAQVNNAIAQLTGKSAANAETITLNLNVGGTYNKPKIGIAGSSASGTVKETVKEAVKEKVTAEVDKAKEEAEAKARAEADRLKAEAEAKVRAEQERLKAEADKKQQELEQKAKEEARKKIEAEKNKLKDRFLKP